MINSVCGIRSTGRICTDLADALETQGHTCKIAYGREAAPKKYQKYGYRITSKWGVRLDALLSRLFGNAGFNSKRATKKFIEWVKQFDPDIIHLHNLHGYYINTPALFDYLKASGKPVIWTLHDCWSFTGHCAHFTTEKCEKWKSECFSCPKYHAYPKSFIDRSRKNYKKKKELFSSLDKLTIVTPSHWLANLARASFLGSCPITVIPNGIDTAIFKPTPSDFRKKHGLSDKKIVLGVASAWGKGKGLYDFVSLAHLLGESYKVVLVGVTKQQKEELPSEILAITRTNNAQELAEIYTAADVFVNPTYCDTYPTVNLEAHACGTPVITYRTGGSVESVAHDAIIEQGDIRALCDKIISGSAKLKTELQVDKASMLAQYENLFQTVLIKS